MASIVIRQDQEWRDLCWEAMHEKDVNKLLTIFLELDRATEGKQLEVFTESVRRIQTNRTGRRSGIGPRSIVNKSFSSVPDKILFAEISN
jgi:hypothetical protein